MCCSSSCPRVKGLGLWLQRFECRVPVKDSSSYVSGAKGMCSVVEEWAWHWSWLLGIQHCRRFSPDEIVLDAKP